MALATCEAVWIDILLQDFGIPKSKAIPLFCDNRSAVYITSNSAFHERSKHIEIDCHTVREKYVAGLIKPMHVSNKFQIADILTKALPGPAFSRLVGKMGLKNVYSHLEGGV